MASPQARYRSTLARMSNTDRAPPNFRWLIASAAAILLITMGVRQTTGLFVLPITTSTGLSIVSVSFALAIGQFVWGASQAAFGAAADKFGSTKILIAGALLLAAGQALVPMLATETGIVFTLGILTATGAAAGSFSILMGATLSKLPPQKQSVASGIINAGGSAGQLVFAPAVQAIIGAAGWIAAMYATAFAALLTIPLIAAMNRGGPSSSTPSAAPTAAAPAGIGMREQLQVAARDRSYYFLHLGFFTCGFHIAFLVTHLPGDIALCGLAPSVAANSLALIGLFNIGGSLLAGWLGQHYRMKYLLAWIYASRAAIVLIYVLMPKTALNIYIVAGSLGFTWLATVPPTAGIVGKLFGTRYLATLFGLTLISHQIGGFLGAWLGGIALARTGSYNWIWYIDIALALAAAVVNLPIREARVVPQTAAA
jgi:predicted MFS family arabinose efflux permease